MDCILLDSIDSIIMDTLTETKDFKEFCSDLDELYVLTDPTLYMESVEDNKLNLRNSVKTIRRNTRSTTVDIGAAYGNVIDGNSKLIKSVWDLTMRALNLMSRVINFMSSKLALIPSMIIKIGNKVGDLPSDIRNKIKGNIKLYITVNDIQSLYNKQLFQKIANFLSLARTLSEGETWGTFFNKRKGEGIFNMKENDMKTCRQMDKIYEEIKALEFLPSVIQMQDQKTVDIYFGDAKSVNFVDLKGARHNSTYYEALIKLMTDINDHKATLDKVRNDIGEKYTSSQMNSSFSKLDSNAQNRIASTIQMISKIINIIGNIVRYITADMNTIDKSTEVLLKKQGIKAPEKEQPSKK